MADERQASSVPSLDKMPGRYKEQFATILLTLVSIIQASVLGYMMTYLHDPRVPVTFWTSARLLSSFLYVIGIWYGYTSPVLALRWVPGLADAVFPFAVGAFEFLTVWSVGGVFWWSVCNAGLALTGALSVLSQFRSASQYPENAAVLSRLSRRRRRIPVLMAAGALWYVALALLSGPHNRAEGIVTMFGLLPPLIYLASSQAGHRIALGSDADSRADTK